MPLYPFVSAWVWVGWWFLIGKPVFAQGEEVCGSMWKYVVLNVHAGVGVGASLGFGANVVVHVDVKEGNNPGVADGVGVRVGVRDVMDVGLGPGRDLVLGTMLGGDVIARVGNGGEAGISVGDGVGLDVDVDAPGCLGIPVVYGGDTDRMDVDATAHWDLGVSGCACWCGCWCRC